MTDSLTTLPGPSPESYTVQDWTKILHHAAGVQPGAPNYAEARQVMGHALQRISTIHSEQNAADSAAAVPGPGTSYAENLAEAASAGIGSTTHGQALFAPGFPAATPATEAGKETGAQDVQDFLSQTRSAHPLASLAGEATGGGGLSTILAAMGVPPSLAMGVPAGTQLGMETGSPAAGVVGGAATAVGGTIAGKVTGALGINKLLGKGVSALASKFAGKEESQMIGNMTVAEVRKALEKKGWDPQAVEQLVAQRLQQQGGAAVRAQSGGVTQEISKEPILSKLQANADPLEQATVLRRAAAKAPKPTIAEINERLAGKRAEYDTHTAETILPGQSIPQPAGGISVIPKGAPKTPADALPEPFQKSRQVSSAIRQLEENLGRPLAQQEKDLVLEKILGAKGSRPGKPVWWGSGAPTPRGPAE